MAIFRVTSRWTGFQGAPGYSNFFFENLASGASVEDARTRVISFFTAVRTLLPADVTISTLGEYPEFDQASGQMTGYLEGPDEGTPVTGSAAGGYSAPSGAIISWQTGGVTGNRRVQGRTFLVPLASSAYEADGTLTSGALDQLRAAGTAMVGSSFDSGFGVWSRPRNGAGGTFWGVNGFRVPDRAAVLRSRRD